MFLKQMLGDGACPVPSLIPAFFFTHLASNDSSLTPFISIPAETLTVNQPVERCSAL
jgi:hypothetical protein